MVKLNVSTKRLQIDKANTSTVIIVSVAAFLTVFSLISCRALMSQRAYQGRVIKEKEKAAKQLKQNIIAVDQLVVSYKEFVDQPQNILGGSAKGTGDRDGDNTKIVLNALPSKYDFPALASSLEKILIERGYKVTAISGSDDELAQAANNAAAPNPQPIELPFNIGTTGSYASMQSLIAVLERSIRPIEVKSLTLSGNDAAMQMTIDAKTYYQPAKGLNITKKEIK